jgi:two-component system sensor histidine kinase UhpB
MSTRLRILILEDIPTDAELMEDELNESGMDFVSKRVATKAAFVSALADLHPDIILADYSLPSFDGVSALKIAMEKCPDTPFIFVSGALGEEMAIELLKKGATDYVLKDRLTRLGPAVTRALKEVEERNERKRAERESETLYRQFFQDCVAGTFRTIYNPSTGQVQYIDCNDAHARMLGYKRREEEINLSIKDNFISDHDLKTYLDTLLNKKILKNFHLILKRKDGKHIWVLMNANARTYKDGLFIIEGTMVDISGLVEAEEKLIDINKQLRSLAAELVMTEERERRQISLDLHDNIGQALALTKIKVDSLQDLSAKHGFTTILNQIQDLISQSILQTRSLITEISPSILYDLGFAEALDWLSEQIETQHGLKVILKNDLKNRDIDKEVQVLLFRAVRELLLNVVKHAKAGRSYITLQPAGENIMVSVKDNGIGFDNTSANAIKKEGGGFGLLSMQERFKYMGGLLKINSSKEYGTAVDLVVPRKIKTK